MALGLAGNSTLSISPYLSSVIDAIDHAKRGEHSDYPSHKDGRMVVGYPGWLFGSEVGMGMDTLRMGTGKEGIITNMIKIYIIQHEILEKQLRQGHKYRWDAKKMVDFLHNFTDWSTTANGY